MITKTQLFDLSRSHHINETTILREYLQIVFLQQLYQQSNSRNIFFKGGTAIHLVFKAPRFSEDLDFTVNVSQKVFLTLFQKTIQSLKQQEEHVSCKERETIAGIRYLLTIRPAIVSYPIFINLDFSFREKVLDPQQSIIETDYPVLITSYIHHLSMEEIAAEKIRTLMTRRKGRDIYDLWYLLSKNISLDNTLIQEKLKYYQMEGVDRDDLIKRIVSFSEKDFVLDLRPFVPIHERDRLPTFFSFVVDSIRQKL